MRILVFAGTTEGRQLVERYADAPGVELAVSCATEYGASLLPEAGNVAALCSRLNAADMTRLMRGFAPDIADGSFDLVVDCTHPYAVEATANIKAAAEAAGVAYVRVEREDVRSDSQTTVPSAQAAADMVNRMEGNVLLTTGTKDLGVYAQRIEGFSERVWARVLPVAESVSAAREAGLPVCRTIAVQGPFSQQLNEAFLREYDIAIVVTKAAGASGGFQEKIDAAKRCGAVCVVVSRPPDGGGIALLDAFSHIDGLIEEKGKLV